MLDIVNSREGLGETIQMLKASVKAPCTKMEYAEFIDRHGLHSLNSMEHPTDEARERWSHDYMAAMKLARYLASPHTDSQTRLELGAAICKLAGEVDVHVDHPALVERAAAVMFENVDTAKHPDSAKRIYRPA